MKGGAIAAAFTAQFPHLIDEGVGLIACAGLMEVRALSLLFMNHMSHPLVLHFFPRYPPHPMIQSDDISRTAKFMSSPLVQSLASSRPVQVSTIFRTLFFGVCLCPILPTPTTFFFGSPRHIYNALQIKPSHAPLSMISQMLSLRYVHMLQCRHKLLTLYL